MNNSNGSHNEKLIISATNLARHIMKLDENIWVFINEGNTFESINHSGMYDKEHYLIRYNREWLKSATEEAIIKCAFHETFHAAQHQAIMERTLGIKSDYFTEVELEKLEHDFDSGNYNDKVGEWGEIFAEQQAEAFAAVFYDKYLETFKSANELIEKYYDMFPNIE